jgi:tetratricopeptide (TPR) repeat protein
MSYQQNPEEVHLWEKIETGSDREKAEAFGRLAEMSVRRCAFDKAVAYGESSENWYRKINDQFGIAEGLYQQGCGYLGLEQPTQALPKFSEAAEIFRANPNEIFLAASVGKQADAYQELEQYGLAVKSYRESACLYANCENYSSAGETYLNGVMALMALREFEQAEFMANQAYDFFVKAEEPLGAARALSQRGWALALQHNLEAALNDANEAITLVELIDQELHLAEFLHEKALFLNRLNRADEVGKALEACRALASRHQNHRLLAECDLQEAYNLKDFGLMDQATEKVKSVMAASKVYSEHDDYFEAQVLMGNVFAAQDKSLEAIEAFEKALAYATLHNIVHFDEGVFVEMAYVLLELQNPSYALETLDRINFEQDLNPEMLGRAKNYRCMALNQLGRHNESQELAQQLIAQHATDPSNMTGILAQENLARSYLLQGNLDLAIPALQLAIVLHSAHGLDSSATQLSRRLLEVQQPAPAETEDQQPN